MKNLLLITTMIFIAFAWLKADDVYLQKGYVVRNCVVKDTLDNKLVIIANGREYFYDLSVVLKIDLKEYNPSMRTELISISEELGNKVDMVQNDTQKYEKYPNLILLPISFISFGLAWDYFEDISQLNESIENFNKLKFDTEELESTKRRKTILGVTFLVAGLVNTIISFHELEIIAKNNSIGLSYKF